MLPCSCTPITAPAIIIIIIVAILISVAADALVISALVIATATLVVIAAALIIATAALIIATAALVIAATILVVIAVAATLVIITAFIPLSNVDLRLLGWQPHVINGQRASGVLGTAGGQWRQRWRILHLHRCMPCCAHTILQILHAVRLKQCPRPRPAPRACRELLQPLSARDDARLTCNARRVATRDQQGMRQHLIKLGLRAQW